MTLCTISQIIALGIVAGLSVAMLRHIVKVHNRQGGRG